MKYKFTLDNKSNVLLRRICCRTSLGIVGYSRADGIGIANEFNKNWDTYLRVGLHDCRDYTNGTDFL